MHIAIFDSGIGGKAVAATLRVLIPKARIDTIDDHLNVPYGNREPKEIIRLTIDAIKPLIDQRYDAIIIACNTATTIAISSLRSSYPDTNFIGIEPMLKPAAQISKTKCIAVCATRGTLQSRRYIDLKRTWASDITVLEPDCSIWASLIEDGRSDDIDIDLMVKSLPPNDIDVVVLGCTHFHWIKQRVIDAFGPSVTVLEPSDAIAERVRNLILDML